MKNKSIKIMIEAIQVTTEMNRITTAIQQIQRVSHKQTLCFSWTLSSRCARMLLKYSQ